MSAVVKVRPGGYEVGQGAWRQASFVEEAEHMTDDLLPLPGIRIAVHVVVGRVLQEDHADPELLGFRFSTLYDSLYESAGYPELSIGTVGPEGRAVPNDSSLIREAEDRVVEQLSREFGYQKVWLQLDRIATMESGRRYLRIDASGTADFGRDGAAPARIEGLYDREQKVWLRVAYVLESALPQPPPAG